MVVLVLDLTLAQVTGSLRLPESGSSEVRTL